MPTPNFLTKIIEDKKKRLAMEKARVPLEELRAKAQEARHVWPSYRLRSALRRESHINIIAEIKRASPSKGDIKRDVEPPVLAKLYEAGGAVAISVLTEADHFRGSLEDLRGVRQSVSLPVLRKDFIFDEYQVYEAAEAGAAALLLIVAALDDETLIRLRRLAEDLHLDVLVEVHTTEEMRRAENCGAQIIGVNNRNLQTFDVSLEVSIELAACAPSGVLLVSESGLHTAADLRRLRAHGYHGFLIGESLMRAANPEATLRALVMEAQKDESTRELEKPLPPPLN